MGRLTEDPTLYKASTGTEYTSFSVAVNRPVKKGSEEQTDFFRCKAFRNTAAMVCNYFKKGQRILIEGTLRTDQYPDKNYPDVTHHSTDIIVDRAEFCDSKQQTQSAPLAQSERNYAPPIIKPGQTKEPAPIPTVDEYSDILGDVAPPF